MFIFDRVFIKLGDIQDMRKTWAEFEFGPDRNIIELNALERQNCFHICNGENVKSLHF